MESRRKDLLEWKKTHGLDFELFLLPNDHEAGTLEDLLESIINPENKPVMDCWESYEKGLSKIQLPWRKGMPLTTPAKKTKIYAYLEALLGKSKSQKDKIKEPNRDYTNRDHWNLDADALTELSAFLTKYLE